MTRHIDDINNELLEAAREIASYVGEASRPGQPAGTSERGREFESVVTRSFCRAIKAIARDDQFLAGAGEIKIKDNLGRIKKELCVKLSRRDESKILIFLLPDRKTIIEELSELSEDFPKCHLLGKLGKQDDIGCWLKRKFRVENWTDCRLKELEKIGWIPTQDDSGRLVDTGRRYSDLYKNLTTSFDATIIYLTTQGSKYILEKKILIECKSAKASKEEKIDGNAHERLSFQNLEYLEIAKHYAIQNIRCDLVLLTNDAFIRYKNKYHSGFGVHALRLKEAFCWYDLRIVSTTDQYLKLFVSWRDWLDD